jgi:hypothetical protein
MAISGTDDQGTFLDTGSGSSLPTQRPSTDVDFHVLAGTSEPDPERADHVLHLPPPRRSASQRR